MILPRWALATVPVDPDHDAARQLAVEELSRREYRQAQPNPILRAITWVFEQVMDALDRVPGNSSVIGAVIVAVVTLLVIALVVRLVSGPVSRSVSRAGGSVFGDTILDAASHRRLAVAAAERGDWRVAVQERFRATARSLEERVILTNRAGRTAVEFAVEAGIELPTTATAMGAAAAVFDDVTYGERPGDEDSYQVVRSADELVAAAKPRALTSA